MGTIRKRKQGYKSYYIYQETYRKKINLKDTGKIKGSGKSKVCTRTIYLGNADEIIRNIKEKRTPAEVEVRNLGLVSAAYQAAKSIKLQEIFKKHIPGNRNGIPSWVFFFVTILNRIEQSTSKNKMSEWLKKSILPELMEFDPCKFTSENFWYATDYLISEKELQKTA
ncbi:transposase-like protein [Candidatus Magnetobacterium bavaricum]|uniref:Transposase-like protein n=1 Tax=Candidatus Magnetobacterium bavaricum TaxID=29290 RepID=A0A0F3GNP9_9BACT|nr:transposase-like protein [Candidatus Magnetobacterium bavaricum]